MKNLKNIKTKTKFLNFFIINAKYQCNLTLIIKFLF